MADWQRHLILSDLWRDPENADVKLAATEIARRLHELQKFDVKTIDDEREGIEEEFRALAEDPNPNLDDINYIINRLYDWADTPLDTDWNGKKVCWVETL